MNREMLKELGLDEESVNRIMIENGKDIEKAKASNEKLQTELAKAKETIQNYEKENIEELKREASEFKLKAGYLEEELKETKNNALLDKSLSDVNTHDTEMLKKVLDMNKIEYKDGKIIGLEEQIAELKQTKSYLFKEERTEESSGIQGIKSFSPGGSGASETSTMQAEIETIFKE